MKKKTSMICRLLCLLIVLSLPLSVWAPHSLSEDDQPEYVTQADESPAQPAPAQPAPTQPPEQKEPAPESPSQEKQADPAGQEALEAVSDPVDAPESDPEEDEAQAQESAEEELAEEAGDSAPELPTFSVTGGLDPVWLAQWKEGKKNNLILDYTVSASAYDAQNNTCIVLGLGLKEDRNPRGNETEEDLRHNISSSGNKFHFYEGKVSFTKKYTVIQSVLNVLPEGDYQIYALYINADGNEKISILGEISLPRSVDEDETTEETKPEGPAPTVSVEAALDHSGQRTVMVLTAKPDGFGEAGAQLQWQVQTDDGDWNDIAGANGYEYRFEPSAATNGCHWRVKATENPA